MAYLTAKAFLASRKTCTEQIVLSLLVNPDIDELKKDYPKDYNNPGEYFLCCFYAGVIINIYYKGDFEIEEEDEEGEGGNDDVYAPAVIEDGVVGPPILTKVREPRKKPEPVAEKTKSIKSEKKTTEKAKEDVEIQEDTRSGSEKLLAWQQKKARMEREAFVKQQIREAGEEKIRQQAKELERYNSEMVASKAAKAAEAKKAAAEAKKAAAEAKKAPAEAKKPATEEKKKPTSELVDEEDYMDMIGMYFTII